MPEALPIDTPPPAKLTEAIVLDLLRARFNNPGNGGSGTHAFLTHVRNGAGFDANRTIDAVSMELWSSRGFALDGYEVKVSRSDWQRELADPTKAEGALKIVDRLTLVAPRGVCRDGELPPNWGLIEVLGDGSDAKPFKLRTATKPVLMKKNPKDRPIPRSILVALLRSAPGCIPGGKLITIDQQAVQEAHRRGVAEGRQHEAADQEVRQRGMRSSASHDQEDLRRLREALMRAGLERHQVGPTSLIHHAAAIAGAVKGATATDRLRNVRDSLARALDEVDAALELPEPEPPKDPATEMLELLGGTDPNGHAVIEGPADVDRIITEKAVDRLLPAEEAVDA